MKSLDLFAGIGGMALAPSDYCEPVLYVEIDPYCRGVLRSRMRDGTLHEAPIHDDVRTLTECEPCDIVTAGFPCQDISIAGRGGGLEGERSGLFFEVMRIADLLRPPFLFLENVPAITFRGLDRVTAELAIRGYDYRWKILSAAEVGAPHERKRWWLLAYSDRNESGSRRSNGSPRAQKAELSNADTVRQLADTNSERGEQGNPLTGRGGERASAPVERPKPFNGGWWTTEPNVGRVAHGVPFRSHRIRALGNAVVPLQAKTAFEELLGLAL